MALGGREKIDLRVEKVVAVEVSFPARFSFVCPCFGLREFSVRACPTLTDREVNKAGHR
jgi:hypothetical protein